jgi:hypothetical protein
VLAVINDVDAGVRLLPHNFGDRSANSGRKYTPIVVLAEFLAVQCGHQIRRPRQAAGVRRQNTIRAGFHVI